MSERPPGAIRVLDHGYVALTDVMGDDRTPARTARTSFANAAADRSEEQDARLTRYLVLHRHTTPLEFIQLRFYIRAPMFVVQQLLRHRTASVNQISHRYVEPDGGEPQFYLPAHARMNRQSTDNKQGSSEALVNHPTRLQADMLASYQRAATTYSQLVKQDLAKELARIVLPAALYTELYWQIDLHNLLHFLALRTDQHAQWEIREYALQMASLVADRFPNCWAADQEYRSQLPDAKRDIDALQRGLAEANTRILELEEQLRSEREWAQNDAWERSEYE